MKIAFCGYREWAKTIYSQLLLDFQKIQFRLIDTKEEVEQLNPDEYDIILFIGWSWIIKERLISTGKCICFHPSRLPKYRGGSPLQNQIMNGETEGAVSLIVMDAGIDTGPILCQADFSLGGNLSDVIENMQIAGVGALNWLIKGFLIYGKMPKATPQDNSQATFFKRRKEAMSEITHEEIQTSTPLQLHNKIRALQDPYPNAFIRCKDGKKLYIIESKSDE